MVKKLAPEETLPFTGHLEELRTRLIVCVSVIVVLFLVLWGISEYLLIPFTKLLEGQKLVFISPTEAFFVHMKAAFFGAVALSVPVLFYQTWAFVAPGLLKQERRAAFPFLLACVVFFALGAAFCYFAVLPFGLKFLIGYGGDLMTPMLSASAMLGFCYTLMFVFGMVFELPIVVVFLNFAGVVYVRQLTSFRPFMVVSAFIVSAIITPPDVFTQIVLALPLVALYELSVLVVRVFGRKEDLLTEGEPVDANTGNRPTDSGT